MLFSISTARSTEDVNCATSRSIRVLSSERRSILVRASLGIELMLDPPSMMPKLKVVRGSFTVTSMALSVNSVIARRDRREPDWPFHNPASYGRPDR